MNWLMMLEEIGVEILDDWRVLMFRLRIVDSDKLRLEIMMTSLEANVREWSSYFDDLNLLEVYVYARLLRSQLIRLNLHIYAVYNDV